MRLMHLSACVIAFAVASTGCDKKEEKAPPTATATPSAEKKVEAPKPTFTKVAPKVSSKDEETSNMKMSLTLDVDPGTGKPASTTMSNNEVETREEEILAVSGDAITKLKVKYGTLDSTSNEGKGDTKKPDARAGKTYIVESKDGKLVVTGEDGKPTVPAEATPIAKDFQTLGKPEPIAAALPTRALKPGESVPEVAKAMTESMKASGKDMDVGDVTATFREQKGDEGIFDVTVNMSKGDGAMKMTMPLKGELRLRTADGQLSGMKLSGPINIAPGADPKAKEKVSGKGTMDMEATRKVKS